MRRLCPEPRLFGRKGSKKSRSCGGNGKGRAEGRLYVATLGEEAGELLAANWKTARISVFEIVVLPAAMRSMKASLSTTSDQEARA